MQAITFASSAFTLCTCFHSSWLIDFDCCPALSRDTELTSLSHELISFLFQQFLTWSLCLVFF